MLDKRDRYTDDKMLDLACHAILKVASNYKKIIICVGANQKKLCLALQGRLSVFHQNETCSITNWSQINYLIKMSSKQFVKLNFITFSRLIKVLSTH